METVIKQSEVLAFMHLLGLETNRTFRVRLDFEPTSIGVDADAFLLDEQAEKYCIDGEPASERLSFVVAIGMGR